MKNLSDLSVDELQELLKQISRVLIDRLADRERELDRMQARLPAPTKKRSRVHRPRIAV
jgi:hypothetical protein